MLSFNHVFRMSDQDIDRKILCLKKKVDNPVLNSENEEREEERVFYQLKRSVIQFDDRVQTMLQVVELNNQVKSMMLKGEPDSEE